MSRATPLTMEAPLGNGELILVVEDNDKVRKATVGRLETLGYAALEARTGPEAITLLGSGDPIALVFSDIVMPGSMTGYDLADWICAMKPDVKVLLTSGHRDEQLAVIATLRQVEVLPKPSTRQQLACALHVTLGGRPLADSIYRLPPAAEASRASARSWRGIICGQDVRDQRTVTPAQPAMGGRPGGSAH